MEVLTMDRREKHNLLVGVHTLHLVESDIDTSAIRVLIHTHILALTLGHRLWLSMTVHHLLLFLRVPFAYLHAVVIVVSAHEDKDCIHGIAMLFHALLSLTRNIIPHTSALGIYIRRYAEPFLKKSPVFLLCSLIARVGD